MDIDPAPQMANLYLYYYEAKFMEMLTKENYSAAKTLNYTRRFIDDLHTLNNDGHLEENNNMGRIYPQELKLNQENQNDDKATFLDLEEQIKGACIEVKTYDKRDAFKFEIINYRDLSGNIPTKPAYGVFTPQVIRYARICSKKGDLLERVKSLTKKTTTETLHHQWPQVITEEMSEQTSLDHDQTGPKTSPEHHRRITASQKNYYQYSRNFWNFIFLLIIPITQASRCTTGTS